jgi:hypothetical protein
MAQSVAFFAYGVLLDQRRMMEVVEGWHNMRTARLDGHRLRFSRHSDTWAGATADLVAAEGEAVYGVIYLILSDQYHAVRRLHTGYVERHLTAETGDGPLPVTTLVVEYPRGGLHPSRDYVRAIDEGLRQHGFAADIRATLWRRAGLEAPGPL